MALLSSDSQRINLPWGGRLAGRYPSAEVVGSLSDVFLDERTGAMAKGAALYYYLRDIDTNLLMKVADLSRRGGVLEVIGDRFVGLTPGGPGPLRRQEMER